MTTATAPADLLKEVDRLKPLISEGSAYAENQRELPANVYDAMFDAGLFSMATPREYGGLESHPVEMLEVWEAVARIDTASAWNLVMNQCVASFFGAYLPAETARQVFGNGPITLAGALNPPAAAVRVEGGWRVTGRVPFASGCSNAQWFAMPAVEMDGDGPKINPETGMPAPFGICFPSNQASILDTWKTYGMRGTGSHDFAVDDMFVSDDFVIPVGPMTNPAPGFEGPLFRMMPWPAIFGEAIVGVGSAAAAVDTAVELCVNKTAAYNATPLKEQQLPQFQIGKAKARVEASRDTLYRAVSDAFDDVSASGALLTVESKVRLQCAASFAAEACAEAVRHVNDAVGSSSIRLEQPFERHFRDTHTLLQHSSKSSPRYSSAGKLMFGVENDWVWLMF